MLPPLLPPCHPTARRSCAAATAAAVLPLPPSPADAAATLLAIAALLPRCLRCSAGAATLLPPPTRRQAERKLPPPPHFRLVARHAAYTNGTNKEGTKRAQTGGEGEYQNWRELL